MIEYQHKLNRIAKQQVNGRIMRPNPQLGIGFDEFMAEMPLIFPLRSNQKEKIIIDEIKMNADYAGYPGKGPINNPDQEPKTGYFGEYLYYM